MALASRLTEPFRANGRVVRPLLAVFVAICGVVAINALIHDARVGYDAKEHIAYIAAVAQGHLPTEDESSEFFAAPLSYALPAIAAIVLPGHPGWWYKVAQLINAAYAVVLAWCLVRLARATAPDDPGVAVWTLLLLGTMAVFYRSIAFIRGEALTAMLAVVACERASSASLRSAQRIAVLGLLCGLVLLAKQWGAFVVAAIFLFEASHHRAKAAVGVGALALIVALPFYGTLSARTGAVVTFNPPAGPVGVNRDPRAFWGIGGQAIFANPVREAFAIGDEPRIWPILYSEMWGDYWRYWLVTGRDVPGNGPATGPSFREPGRELVTNVDTMAPYLGRVNLVSLLPTAVLFAGVVLGVVTTTRRLLRRGVAHNDGIAVSTMVVLATAGGYLAALAWLPDLGIKGSHLLQALPMAALLGAVALTRLHAWSPNSGRLLKAALLLAALHNLPTLFSRYSVLGGFPEWH